MVQPVQTMLVASNVIGGLIQGEFGNYLPGSDGLYTIDTRDFVSLQKAGVVAITKRTAKASFAIAPAAASATVTVANVAVTNVALTIAAQPDVCRPLQFIMAPGAAAVTAGTLTLVYVGNDGLTHTEVSSLVTPLSTSVTINTVKSVARLTSATVANFAGGSSPTIEGGTTAYLGLPADPGFTDFAVESENDGSGAAAVGTVNATQGAISPTGAPNATRTYEFTYSFNSPTA